jgi:hypothetical protein
MGDIYKNAVEVISWLGEDKDDSEFLFRLLATRKGIQRLPLPSLGDRSPACERQQFEWLRKAAFAFNHRDYWRRVWIIQEVIPARKLVVWCGWQTAGVKQIATNTRRLHHVESQDHWYDESTRHFYEVLPTEDDHISDFLGRSGSNTTWAWYDIMKEYGNRQGTEPQDRIYGLQGLVDPQARVTVNYRARKSDLLEAVMKPAVKEVMKPAIKEFAGECDFSSRYQYDERIEKLGWMLADALFGQEYPIHFLVLLQELAWHISVFQVVHQPITMLKNLRHLQDVIILART